MAAGSEGLHQGPQPYQILGVSFFLKSETEEINFSEKFDVELNEPYLVFKQIYFSFTMALDYEAEVVAIIHFPLISTSKQRSFFLLFSCLKNNKLTFRKLISGQIDL